MPDRPAPTIRTSRCSGLLFIGRLREFPQRTLATPRPYGWGFPPSPARAPVSPPIAPGRAPEGDVSSAGCHRWTSGQDVLRGVDVPVVPAAAGRALPRPGGKAQLGEQVPARRADLRRGVPAVDEDELPAVAPACV